MANTNEALNLGLDEAQRQNTQEGEQARIRDLEKLKSELISAYTFNKVDRSKFSTEIIKREEAKISNISKLDEKGEWVVNTQKLAERIKGKDANFINDLLKEITKTFDRKIKDNPDKPQFNTHKTKALEQFTQALDEAKYTFTPKPVELGPVPTPTEESPVVGEPVGPEAKAAPATAALRPSSKEAGKAEKPPVEVWKEKVERELQPFANYETIADLPKLEGLLKQIETALITLHDWRSINNLNQEPYKAYYRVCNEAVARANRIRYAIEAKINSLKTAEAAPAPAELEPLPVVTGELIETAPETVTAPTPAAEELPVIVGTPIAPPDLKTAVERGAVRGKTLIETRRQNRIDRLQKEVAGILGIGRNLDEMIDPKALNNMELELKQATQKLDKEYAAETDPAVIKSVKEAAEKIENLRLEVILRRERINLETLQNQIRATEQQAVNSYYDLRGMHDMTTAQFETWQQNLRPKASESGETPPADVRAYMDQAQVAELYTNQFRKNVAALESLVEELASKGQSGRYGAEAIRGKDEYKQLMKEELAKEQLEAIRNLDDISAALNVVLRGTEEQRKNPNWNPEAWERKMQRAKRNRNFEELLATQELSRNPELKAEFLAMATKLSGTHKGEKSGLEVPIDEAIEQANSHVREKALIDRALSIVQ
ncbi:MAG: hypothetical protein V1821_02530, partial [bacterium]